MKRLVALLSLSMFSLFALSCGPIGGPAKGKKLTELNDNQAKRLCKQMDRKSSDCDSEEFKAPEDCGDYGDQLSQLPDDCAATAGDARECAKACGDQGNGGCQALFGCAFAGN